MSVAARAGGRSRTAPFGLLGDERLARLAAAGHEQAFAVVYQRHHQALYRYCRSILRNDPDAQDALQSTFAAAFAALRRERPDAPIRPWLFRIAHNEAVSALRRRRPTSDLSAASNWCTTSVEDQVAERAQLDVLLRDLRELNERQRSALVMRELSGLSHEEIAIALATTVGAAKQTIYEARRSLFEFAEGRAMSCDEIRRSISDADGRLLRSRRVRAHLRECPGCAAFAAAIPARSRELRALAPPLPTVAAAGLLGHLAGGGASSSAGGLAGLATGAAGKSAGLTMAANALAGVAVVASATVGVTVGVDKLVQASEQARHGHPLAPISRSVITPARSTLLPPSGSPSPGAGQGNSAAGASARRQASPAARSVSNTAPAGRFSPSATAPGRGDRHSAGGGTGGGSAAAGRSDGTENTSHSNGPPPWAGSGQPASAGSGNSASHGSGNSAAHGSENSASHGAGNSASHGSENSAAHGSAKSNSNGAGKSDSNGAGKPASSGNGRPSWAGARKPASAGAGRPASPGDGPLAANPVSAAEATPLVTSVAPIHTATGGPPAGTPGAANSAGHGD